MSDAPPAHPARSASLPAAGTVIAGKYRIEQAIGRGGMGVVALAWHLALEERVALKFLSPDVAERGAAIERFLREARASARLRSIHACRVFDVARLDDGAPYIVMEYLAGVDLARRLREKGPLGVAEAVDFAVQACEALAEAHSLGIVHRDIKPPNLFITTYADGAPCIKVLDFGIAKMPIAGGSVLTDASRTVGSAAYMSPEQMRGSRDVDHRTDIWAMGVTLYELLAGRRPFLGDSPTEVCAQVLESTPIPLVELRKDVPQGLSDAVGRCLRQPRDDRFANAGELAVALAPYGSPASVHKADAALRAAQKAPSLRQLRASDAAISAQRAAPTATLERGSAVASTESHALPPSRPSTLTLARPARFTLAAAAVSVVLLAAVAARRSRHVDAPRADGPAAESAIPAPAYTIPAPSASAPEPPAPALTTVVASATPSAAHPATAGRPRPAPRAQTAPVTAKASASVPASAAPSTSGAPSPPPAPAVRPEDNDPFGGRL